MTKIELDRILNKIKKELSQRPEILAVYLYGSQAYAPGQKGGDLDIGILLDPDCGLDYFSYQGQVLGEFEHLIPGLKTDAIVVNYVNPIMRYEIVAPRQVIFCQDDAKRAAIEVQIFNDYFERLPYFELAYQSALERARANLTDAQTN